MKGPKLNIFKFHLICLISANMYCVDNLRSLNSFTVKRKKRVSGFRTTPTKQRKHRRMPALNAVKASLYGRLAWTCLSL